MNTLAFALFPLRASEKKSSAIHCPTTTSFRCPICLNDDTGPFKTNCNHLFHEKCLVTWMKRKENCPLCKNHELNLVTQAIESGWKVWKHWFEIVKNGKLFYKTQFKLKKRRYPRFLLQSLLQNNINSWPNFFQQFEWKRYKHILTTSFASSFLHSTRKF